MLGKFPVPVEVIKFAEALVAKEDYRSGSRGHSSREHSRASKFITDEGNHILDCHFGQIPDPPALARNSNHAGSGGTWVVYWDGRIALIGKGDQVVEMQRLKP